MTNSRQSDRLSYMTTAPQLKDTHTIRAVTVPDAAFDNHAVERIVHVMRCGREVLARDVQTFKDEAERYFANGETNCREGADAARALDRTAAEFQRYVDEADRLIVVIEQLNADNVLAFVSFEQDTSPLLDALNEILAEDGQIL